MEVFGFDFALRLLKEGKRVTRRSWGMKKIFLEIQVPDKHSKMTQPYIYMDATESDSQFSRRDSCPWLPAQADILASDWMEYVA